MDSKGAVPFNVFVKQLREEGFPESILSNDVSHFNYLLNFISVEGKGKLIEKKDAELLLDSLKKFGPELFSSLPLFSGLERPSALLMQFKKKYKEQGKALKESTKFVLENFFEVFAAVNKIRVGNFRFRIGVSPESKIPFVLSLTKSDGAGYLAQLNFDLRVSKDGKPVIVVKNFHGGRREKIMLFEAELRKSKGFKGKPRVFKFMLDSLISGSPKRIRIEAANPRKLPFIVPDEGVVKRRLIEEKKLAEPALFSELLLRWLAEKKISVEQRNKLLGKEIGVGLSGTTIKENQIIAAEQRMIASRALRMHYAALKSAGFRKKKKNKRKSVLVLKRK
ncbi:MAG: hypothetical protein ABIJ74_04270 [archaeon]